RRRHTRWPRDWSSDVCSSDLAARRPARSWSARTPWTANKYLVKRRRQPSALILKPADSTSRPIRFAAVSAPVTVASPLGTIRAEIGRASCRERGGELWRRGGG